VLAAGAKFSPERQMIDNSHRLKQEAERVLEIFRRSGMKLATAESCTGGLIAAIITAIPGSSDVFDRGFVTYSNEAKQEMLGVKSDTLDRFGAVSAQTAIQMAEGALANSKADAVAAVTGIAGPGGGSKEKPVGLVCIAVANRGHSGVFVEEYRFESDSREEIRNLSVKMAFEMLLSYAVGTRTSG
jgi:nicotinamide-nucleotide amidase